MNPIGFTLKKWLNRIWEANRFDSVALQEYATPTLLNEARQGLRLLCLVLLILLLFSSIGFRWLAPKDNFSYSFGLLALLSLHIYYSALTVRDIKALHALGTTLLVICGVALTFISTHEGAVNPVLAGCIVLLFMVIPLIPWGLREAVLVIFSIYLTFTLSFLGRMNILPPENQLLLQSLMIGSGALCLVLVARNTLIRKNELQSHYQLDQVKTEMERMALVDALTGAWNRRFLERSFDDLVDGWIKQGEWANIAMIDIDYFKQINDSAGHDQGDKTLQFVAEFLSRHLTREELLVRLGGDEFLLVVKGPDAESRIDHARHAYYQSGLKLKARGASYVPTLSIGLVKFRKSGVTLSEVLSCADAALYQAKADGRNCLRLGSLRDAENP